MADGYLLDRTAIRRMGAQTRKGELRPTDLRERNRDRRPTPETTVRFKLLTPLEVGKPASGRVLVRVATDDEGGYEWVPTDREEPLYATPGVFNHLPAGAEVNAELTASGWRARLDELWCGLPGDIEPFPYMVLRTDFVSSSGSSHRDAILLQRPLAGELAAWEDDYVFTTACAPPSTVDDALPDELPKPRMIGCTPVLPAKVTYEPFNALLPDGTPIPASILQAMGQTAHPQVGELWGPSSGAKLIRSLTFLELFWWELCPPDWQCVPGQINNPGYDPTASACQRYDPPGTLIPNPDYDPDATECQPTIDGDVWGIVCDGEVIARAADPEGGPGNLPCTEDPPDDPHSAFWIGPVGWWGLGGWHWNWFWDAGWWSHPSGWWNLSLSWNDAWWWGPWGFGWWFGRWGGRPPTPDELLELTEADIPDPPCGGDVLKRARYGFIVWEYGWRVLGADTGNQVATIVGPIEFRRPYLVVEHDEPPDSACDQNGGTGTQGY